MEKMRISCNLMTEIVNAFFKSSLTKHQPVTSTTVIKFDSIVLANYVRTMIDYKAVPSFKAYPYIEAIADNASNHLFFYIKYDKILELQKNSDAEVTLADIHPLSRFVMCSIYDQEYEYLFVNNF